MGSGGTLQDGVTSMGVAGADQAGDRDQDKIARMESIDRVIHDAKLATEKEQKMSLLEGIKLYPKAIAWSVLISTCIVMVCRNPS